VTVPHAVREIAGPNCLRTVWENQFGGLTFEVTGPADRCFVKWSPAGSGIDPEAEPARLRWAAPYTRVPHVRQAGWDGDGAWLVTEALPGRSAVDERWRRAPARAVAAMGEGLRAFHDSLPPASCPFTWTTEDRLEAVNRRASAGLLRPASWHREHRALTVDQALALLAAPPPLDSNVVVCHGDACAPNTLVGDDGRCTGHVDLGSLGTGDRWADLAIATWSTQWNFGPGWEGRLLSAYGVEPDPDRTAYFRLLWDLGP
jgi:kanamycin kinase